MLEPLEIMQTVARLLAFDQSVNGKRILITAGGTRERIDSVRYIGNMSTGRTAARLAEDLTVAGHSVTWLGARDAVQPVSVNKIESYYSFADLEARLQLLLGSGEYDVVIHAAAVSDFSVASIESSEPGEVDGNGGKLSSKSGLVLHLEPNPKLLDSLKSWSGNPALQVIGFKLTDTDDQQRRLTAIKKQFNQSGVDAVVHNDLSEISQTAHPFYLYAPSQEPVHCADGEALAQSINELVGTIR
jgi:phosphopantothenoylcysteine decarboxylase/phosphopantothenate--cysteine ligase